MKIAIYTLYQKKEFNRCVLLLNHLRKQLCDNIQLYILINDGYCEKIDKYINGTKNVTLLWKNKNIGVAGGRNYLITYARNEGCKFFISIDNDILIPSKFIKILRDTYYRQKEKDPTIGFAQPIVFNGKYFKNFFSLDSYQSWEDIDLDYKFNDFDTKSLLKYMKKEYPSCLVEHYIFHAGVTNRWRSDFDAKIVSELKIQSSKNIALMPEKTLRQNPIYLMYLISKRKPIRVVSTAGGMTCFDYSVIEKTGDYNEIFNPFAYEDSELGCRAALQGLNNYLFPNISVVHDFFGGITNRTIVQLQCIGKLRGVYIKNNFFNSEEQDAALSISIIHHFFDMMNTFDRFFKMGLEAQINASSFGHAVFTYFYNFCYGCFGKSQIPENEKNIIKYIFDKSDLAENAKNGDSLKFPLTDNSYIKTDQWRLGYNVDLSILYFNAFNIRVEATDASRMVVNTEFFDIYVRIIFKDPNVIFIDIDCQSQEYSSIIKCKIDYKDWNKSDFKSHPKLIEFNIHTKKYDYGAFSEETIYPKANPKNSDDLKTIAKRFQILIRKVFDEKTQKKLTFIKNYFDGNSIEKSGLIDMAKNIKTKEETSAIENNNNQIVLPMPNMHRVKSSERKKILKSVDERYLGTIIIGFTINDDSRTANLLFLLKWIDFYYKDLFAILLVEQGPSPIFNFKQHGFKLHISYRYIYNPEHYNRGWGYNVAVKHYAKTKIVILMDTDVLTGNNFVKEVISCYKDYDVVSPYQNIYYSSEVETENLMNDLSLNNLNDIKNIRNPVSLSGGVLIIKRDLYMSLKGFEQYMGYGGEDRAFDVTLFNHCDKKRIRKAPYAYPHLYHETDSLGRYNSDTIFKHLSENYQCKFYPEIKPFEDIHKKCNHVDKTKTQKLILSRTKEFGNIDLYKIDNDLEINGIVPSNNIVSSNVHIFPQSDDIHVNYEEREFYKSPNADTDELKQFYNAFKGKRCFIIGNGPSLNLHDLNLLGNEYTFGVNSFYYKTEETGFTPFFYVVEDSSVMKENIDEIKKYDAPFKFFPTIYRDIHPKENNTFFFEMNRGFYEKTSPNYVVPRFSTDASKVLYCGQSVTYINLQLAFFMGFVEVYLIGMDFSYKIPSSHKRKGDVLYSDTDDPNHFHKDYFGKGKTWKDPKLERVAINYEMAKLVYEGVGRKIFNATVGGKLEIFERIDYLSLFEKNRRVTNKTSVKLNSPKYNGKLNNKNTNTVYVVGNGPSLKDFDFNRINGYSSFGMNSAYRYWEKIKWYPTYYICLDTVVTESNKNELNQLIRNKNENGIQLFILRKNILRSFPELSNDPKVIFYEDYLNTKYFVNIEEITTGSFSALFAAMLGFKNIRLVGIDLNYVQIIPEAKKINSSVLEIKRSTNNNPNYFFNDYQRPGDRYHIPDALPDLHYKSWVKVKERLSELGVDVVNGNISSKLNIFDYMKTGSYK